ncbi:uncharacterized protein LOC128954891 [Oppia nitens]|uniref:uncharacterized protein LOC128954891 n=1 Tax=Oppia nitens TaxID=1686743 RepID=UPI0023DB8312|nr:uncharacterized protein LOC128954891 [Oppia nitens]
MNYKFINEITIRYNPSVIEYSHTYQLFICGTYQLCEDQSAGDNDQTLARINNRFGSLGLITRSNQLISDFECPDGGVFDLRLIRYDSRDDCPLVAHANGSVAIYCVDNIDSDHKFQLIRRFVTESKLLTCLTTISDNELAITGDSDGKLSIVHLTDDQSVVRQLSVTKFGEPVWTLFNVRLNNNYVLFVGSDDSKWRAYCLTAKCLPNITEVFTQLTPLYVNKDPTAGVTSFATNNSSDNSLSLIVGSYDEFIRYYDIDYITDDITGECLQLSVLLKYKLHIPGSGIWRIIVQKDQPNRHLVSGMYSGAHLVCDHKVVQTLEPSDTFGNENHLIYGLNCDKNFTDILMASFYGQTLYLFSMC